MQLNGEYKWDYFESKFKKYFEKIFKFSPSQTYSNLGLYLNISCCGFKLIISVCKLAPETLLCSQSDELYEAISNSFQSNA